MNARAACAGVDPEGAGFFATGLDRLSARAALHAITTYCLPCPIRAACLAEGRDADAIGVWGGVLRPEPWSKAGADERTADDLERLAHTPFATVEGPSCERCGRVALKRNKKGGLSAHVALDGSWCTGPTEDAAA